LIDLEVFAIGLWDIGPALDFKHQVLAVTHQDIQISFTELGEAIRLQELCVEVLEDVLEEQGDVNPLTLYT
jgi:hypothetical protein